MASSSYGARSSLSAEETFHLAGGPYERLLSQQGTGFLTLHPAETQAYVRMRLTLQLREE